MKGDFSRLTFDPSKNYSRVLMQQGRVQLDADWNEMAEIQLHYLRSLARDLGGEHWGPYDSSGFKISSLENNKYDFTVGAGIYYVMGIQCCVKRPVTYTSQNIETLPNGLLLIYLDVCEKHITHIEDDHIREVALEGCDTTTRTTIIWQIGFKKLLDKPPFDNPAIYKKDYVLFLAELGLWNNENCYLRAKAKETSDQAMEPCLISPEARYRGLDNRLYRVEVHREGPAWDGVMSNGLPAGNAAVAATFKWSRENGSVIFPIRDIKGNQVFIEHLKCDDRFSLKEDNWVEVVYQDDSLHGKVEPLFKINSINKESMCVTLNSNPIIQKGADQPQPRLLRRWDHHQNKKGVTELTDDGTLLIKEALNRNIWLPLEDGIQIQFLSPDDEKNSHYYRKGDYWLIPARTAKSDIEWPGTRDNPTPSPPHGVVHHYAPLALISVDATGKVKVDEDLRRILNKLWA